jgi:hypothetical protein
MIKNMRQPLIGQPHGEPLMIENYLHGCAEAVSRKASYMSSDFSDTP